MPRFRDSPFTFHILKTWYWAVAILLACAVWAGAALAVLPLKGQDGTYASRPYGLTTGMENQVLDLLFQLRDGARPAMRARGFKEPITLIEIDEPAIKASKIRLQKWPRNWYARLVDRASEGGATVIGLDLLLGEEGGTSTEDKAADAELANSIASAGNVVLAMKTEAGGWSESKPLQMFSDAAYTVGYVDIPLDKDSFVRSSQLFRQGPDGETQYSFATRVVEGHLTAKAFTEKLALLQEHGLSEEEAANEASTYAQQNSALRPGQDGTVLIGGRVLPLRNDLFLQLDFRGRPPAFRRISASEILFNQSATIPDDLFRDRMVLIGASNIDAPDLFPTPFYEPMTLARLFNRSLTDAPARTPGVELHATTAATMLFGRELVRPRYGWQVAALLLPIGLMALAVFRLRAGLALLAGVLIVAGTLVLSSWAFNAHGLILPLATAWLGIGVLTPLGLGLRYAREQTLRAETEKEREQVMDIFSRFVSSEVAVELWERRGQASLAGEMRVVTIIFTDIRNFTTLSEAVSSDKVVEWLNDYFGRMHAVVESFGGHVNKFLGDGVMIVFGAPLDRGEQREAQAAVDCGLAMLEAVEAINEEWRKLNRPEIHIGVGIHTGEATCGVLGAERRLEYTVIGDTVNLAARLESTTKDLNVSLVVSESTHRLLGDGYETRPLGEVKVKGKTAMTSVYTVLSKKLESETTVSPPRTS